MERRLEEYRRWAWKKRGEDLEKGRRGTWSKRGKGQEEKGRGTWKKRGEGPGRREVRGLEEEK